MKASTKRKPKLRSIHYDHACHAITLYLQALSILDDDEVVESLMPDYDTIQITVVKGKKDD